MSSVKILFYIFTASQLFLCSLRHTISIVRFPSSLSIAKNKTFTILYASSINASLVCYLSFQCPHTRREFSRLLTKASMSWTSIYFAQSFFFIFSVQVQLGTFVWCIFSCLFVCSLKLWLQSLWHMSRESISRAHSIQ